MGSPQFRRKTRVLEGAELVEPNLLLINKFNWGLLHPDRSLLGLEVNSWLIYWVIGVFGPRFATLALAACASVTQVYLVSLTKY